MADLELTSIKAEAGDSLRTLVGQAQRAVSACGTALSALLTLRQKINTNADGAFENPADLNKVDGKFAGLATDICTMINAQPAAMKSAIKNGINV